MAKVSFRMASASRESVFGVQTSTARKNHRSARTMLILDRQTGVITTLATGAGAPAGPAFAQRATRTAVWGVRPGCCVVKFQAFSADNTIAGSTGFNFPFPVPPSGQVLDVPHVDMSDNPTNLGLSWVTSDVNTGGMINAGTALIGLREGADPRADFGDATTPASHPVARRGDGYVALDRTSGSDADIQTISFPSETALTPAPAPITSTQPERMPAWAPGAFSSPSSGPQPTAAARCRSSTSRPACRRSSTRRSTSGRTPRRRRRGRS